MVDLEIKDEEPASALSDPGEIQYRLFVTLWVMAFTFHYFERDPLDGWAVILAAIPCLIFPSSFAALGAFVAVSMGVVIYHMPAASNHFMLAALVNLALAGAAIVVLMARKTSGTEHNENRDRWLRLVFTPVGFILIVVYFFTVFHKLNTSFFNPEVSCAGSLLRRAQSLHGLPPFEIPDNVILLSAVLTIVCEGLILILIAVPRLRRWGILVGVIFHGLLIWSGFYDFATFVLAIYVLLLPRESFGRIPNFEAWRLLAISGWIVHGMVGFFAHASNTGDSPIGLKWNTIQVLIWLATVIPLILPVLKVNFFGDEPLTPPRWRLRPAWLLVVPLLAFLNGSTAYLGLKTVANYSMFSNLRTEEGRTNHLIPAVGALEMTGILRDTVDLHELRFPKLGRFEREESRPYWLIRQMNWASGNKTRRFPWLELQRAANLWVGAGLENVYVRFTHNGVQRELTNGAADPELAEPLPLSTRLLLAYREIEQGDGPVHCRW